MKVAYADPPYPGQSKKHYGDHPDYDGEVDHRELLLRIDDETAYDGWLLHTSSPALESILHMTAELGIGPFRVMAWVKPWATSKRNVKVMYAWEPVLVKPCRNQEVSGRTVMRDFISSPITLAKGLVGVKPEPVCRWAFEMLGMTPGDELDDLFVGSGAVTRAWNRWRNEITLGLDSRQTRSRQPLLPEAML